MSEPNVVHTLRRKRDDIEAAIVAYERRLSDARRDLQHVNATLQLFEAAASPEGVRVYQDIHRLFRRGEITALCRAALAERGPLDTRELAQAVMDAKGFADDRELRKAIAYKVVQALNMHAKRGTIGDAGYRKGVRVWAIPA
ncbi:hypothetical protein [Hansschlegelia zhihuaiae]|uniref:Uncharacterized protein n=1 Tax=Hansschlegelia zhihuaiae TaxID=405005 RepID=A0A4Q0M377_9HYPH|nr:hypothetical protein [Hansschlegelia zhihuaiae]RXF67119.1 hypothetical protein EK403_21735 [Hansschlegelia zhihuaiae]